MKVVELKDATAPLMEYAGEVETEKEPLMLTVDGRPVAVLLAVENVDTETVTLSTHPKFLALIERSRTRYKEEGASPVKKCGNSSVRVEQDVTSCLELS